MIPTVLSKIENYNGFLGSFDQVKWWKSKPLAGVAKILDVCHIYGEYHICAAKMLNGTYSIWQTWDHGYQWRQQLNTAERILCIIRPDYGVALASTSGGWWKSTNSGTDWSKISTQAPNCHTVKELTKNILVALDGTYIWRSANGGATWTKAVIHGTGTAVTAKTQYPTVAGTSSDCLVGCTSTNIPKAYRIDETKILFWGKDANWGEQYDHGEIPDAIVTTINSYTFSDILLFSDDGAVSFSFLEINAGGWTFREHHVPYTQSTEFIRIYYSHDVTIPNLFPRATYKDIITDIEMSGLSSAGKPYFVIQVRQMSGSSVGLLRHYYVIREQLPILNSSARFDAYETPGQSLSSYRLVRPTTGVEVNELIYSGMTPDAKPMIKVSTDRGQTWTAIDLSKVTVYSNPDLTSQSINPFTDDVYTTYSWVNGTCHNSWILVEDHFEKYQSYDMDILWAQPIPKTKTYSAKAYIAGPAYAHYIANVRLDSNPLVPQQFSSRLVADHSETYEIKAYIAGQGPRIYWMHRYLEGYPTATYQMGAIISQSVFPELVLPQAFDVKFPAFCESGYPYDSRNEEEET